LIIIKNIIQNKITLRGYLSNLLVKINTSSLTINLEDKTSWQVGRRLRDKQNFVSEKRFVRLESLIIWTCAQHWSVSWYTESASCSCLRLFDETNFSMFWI